MMILHLRRDRSGTLTLPAGERDVRWHAARPDEIVATAEGARFDLAIDVRDLFPDRAKNPRWAGYGTVDGDLVRIDGHGATEGLVARITAAP